jgi:hypothetical protein
LIWISAWTYIWVLSTDSWPSQSAITVRSTPIWSAWGRAQCSHNAFDGEQQANVGRKLARTDVGTGWRPNAIELSHSLMRLAAQ